MSSKTFNYVRVSIAQQGRSGLGIETPAAGAPAFATAGDIEVLGEFVEVEKGKGSDAMDRRPQLKAALAAARKHKCHVSVSKLDRIGRDVHFISGLMATKSFSSSLSRGVTWTPLYSTYS